MDDLDASQLRRALHVANALVELRDLRAYPRDAASLVRELIPCEPSGYNALDLATARAEVTADPAEFLFDGGLEALMEFLHQNPLVAASRTHHDLALRLSDFIRLRDLHRTELYQYVYRRIGQEHQLAITLPSPRRTLGRPRELVALTLGRGRHDFTPSEQRLLELLRPHFAAALERVHELAFVHATGAGDRSGIRWLLLVDHDATVAWATPAAAEALSVSVGAPAPAALRRWLATARGRRGGSTSDPLDPPAATDQQVIVDGREMRARLIHDAYPGLDAVELVPATRELPVALAALGLTRRQAQILAVGLYGRTSAQIGDALGLSARTVEKHFEAIYGRLGVTNRAQAVALAVESLHR
jgi:DNA-binding CsgD family transcriptional regulator